MAYTTNQLISGAYYASGIVSREFETVTGSQVSDGLEWLNQLLARKVVDHDVIPYEGSTTFNSVVGQEDYSIENLIKVDTLTFVKDGTLRYSLQFVPRNQYRGSSRVETIKSLPYQYYYERNFGGATISLYFLPNNIYPFTVTGIFRLSSVALGQDLSLTLDEFYTTFLRYELTEKMCLEFGMPVPAAVAKELGAYRAIIEKQSKVLDVSLRKQSTLQSENRLGWAYINLGEGFIPP